MRPLVVIPARGGSKRLPSKNIKPLNGQPLIHYTIEAAREVFDDSIICVSTDDKKIKQVSESVGLNVPFLRPKDLATDKADSRSVLLHALEYYKERKKYEADVIVLLQPTSPFRNANHIKGALNLYKNDLDMVVSAFKTKSNPYFVLFEEDEKGMARKIKKGNYTRSQDCPTVWELNGAIYIISARSLIRKQIHELSNVKLFKMDELYSVDIDDELDFLIAEHIINKIED
ncbi:MAG: acylneuraminate cytidylyltransferase family protein [Gracilimonas sp.]|uniref:acylneuraminate cytidylyltransferase family protein n=1 Tax=Gracilimonas sp. TaxID=1974203 RepID=UPI001B0EE22E|nr:acylneuraminate cytidylyltransferase family protein [Gracilimonas sp.]MBO6587228.1 acylneuraminate cytidylyltransferase family protein [Gracilimonas sp.]MBO6614284.1 acylneuraminate cytidylyltransferase family protein [Gracilimonas sp.]